MKIQVTEEAIKKGVCNSSTGCPIALALRRTLNKECKYFPCPSVTENYIHIINEPGVADLRIPTPVEAFNFIEKFDAKSEEVDPFEFELDYNPTK